MLNWSCVIFTLLQDTKGSIIIRKSKRNRQYNGQKKIIKLVFATPLLSMQH